MSSAGSNHTKQSSFILMSSLYILLLLLISFLMTRFSEEAVMFPINTQAYFRAVVCTARLPLVHQSASCTHIKPALHVVNAFTYSVLVQRDHLGQMATKCGIVFQEIVLLKHL